MLMSLPDLVAKYDMKINGVLHCGAHLAEEAAQYHAIGTGPVWWVEANPEVIPKIRSVLARYPGQEIIEALLWSDDESVKTFNVTNYDGMSSSILQWGTHPTFSPDTVFVEKLALPTSTIDTLAATFDIHANLVNLDLQGVEGPVLLGAEKFLAQVDYVYTEVNKVEVYLGCSLIGELDAILSDFRRVETSWVGDQGWGDALYVSRRSR